MDTQTGPQSNCDKTSSGIMDFGWATGDGRIAVQFSGKGSDKKIERPTKCCRGPHPSLHHLSLGSPHFDCRWAHRPTKRPQTPRIQSCCLLLFCAFLCTSCSFAGSVLFSDVISKTIGLLCVFVCLLTWASSFAVHSHLSEARLTSSNERQQRNDVVLQCTIMDVLAMVSNLCFATTWYNIECLASSLLESEVHFTAKSLDDQVDQLVLSTEAGNLSLPVEALKVLPPSLK